MKTSFAIQFGKVVPIHQKKHVREFLFPFRVTESRFGATTGQQSRVSRHEIYAGVTDVVEQTWRLPEAVLIKVLFEYVKQEIERKMKAGSLLAREEFLLGREDVPDWPPLDHERIEEPSGAVLFVTI